MKKKRSSTSRRRPARATRTAPPDPGPGAAPSGGSALSANLGERRRPDHETLPDVQEQLEIARGEFARLYDSAPIGYLSLSESGWLKQINPTGADLLGCSREQALARPFAQFVAEEDRRRFLNGLSQCRLGVNTRLNAEFRLSRMRKDEPVDVELTTGFVIELEEGERVFQCALIDVSARKRAEHSLKAARDELEARVLVRTGELRAINQELVGEIAEREVAEQTLRESEERLRSAIEGTLDHAIFLLTPDGNVASWNSGAQRMKGYSEREILGRHFSEFYPPPDVRAGVPARVLEEALENGRTEDEGWRIRRNGSRFWATAVTTALFDEEGRVKGFSRVTRDTTESRKAHETLRASERALADFFDHSPVGLFWIRRDGLISRVNGAMLELLGFRLEECLGRPIQDFFDDVAAGREMLDHLSRREVLRNRRVRLKRRDNSLLQVLIDANGMWEKGRLVYSRWFVRDITRQVELEHQILVAGEDVRRRIGLDLHDDLCQQLAGIEFFSQTLAGMLQEKSAADSKRAREIAGLIREAITYTRNLARGLSPIDLESKGLIDALQELAARTRKMFQIDCRFRSRNVSEVLDRATNLHLYRIAQEAVTNAVRHGNARQIEIGLSQTKVRLVLAVKDNGTGIRRKRSRESGMGLRVMQYRAGVISGTLVVQRNPGGRGTSVICSINRNRIQRAKASEK